MKVTCDVGGTFTDVVVSDDVGRMHIGKRLTTPHDLIEGLLSALDPAAAGFGLTVREVLERTDLFVYSTTQATNAILEGRTARTALLCTEGFPDVLVRREGGSMHPYDFRRPYPESYVPRRLIFEIRERIGADGEVVIPLDVEQAREVLRGLAGGKVEAIAVALLWSVANGEHERALGDLIADELPGVPFTLSHQLNPIMREYRRTSCTAIDASLKPLMQSHLRSIESGLRKAGLNGQLVAATSMGGVLPIEHLAERPIYAAKSGPSLAPVAAQLFASAEADSGDAIVCDTGGTSFDVSLVREGAPVFTRETWLGDPFSGHHTGLASVDVRSIGAGGGSIAWLDAGGLLHVGPDSAGADPGPACYGRGGMRPTVTDASLVLGYLDPERFLGGEMALDEDAATAVVSELGDRLGLDPQQAAAAIVTIASEHMVGAIREITINQGVDPREVLIVAGGGAAGLNIAAIARALEARRVLIPSAAGALSAFGGQHSDIVFESGASVSTDSVEFDFAQVDLAFAEIGGRLDDFSESLGAGIGDCHTERFVEACYAHQVWTLELPLEGNGIETAEDVATLVEDFHDLHHRMFAVREPGQRVELLHCRGRLVAEPLKPALAARSANGSVGSPAATRQAYFPDEGRLEVPVYEGASLAPGITLEGPLLVTEPITTVVVPPGVSLRVTDLGNYLLEVT
ncbi:MAG TPA: hydantoinase/oxoprolinase family protein [Candidatus Dormibacteraeota bacterium]|nr:hydantoinase/oxoprolinase family protein [Candidatus Dormibacteraeota bacterium]